MPSDSEKLAKSSSDVGMDMANNVKEGMKNGLGGQKDHLVVQKYISICRINKLILKCILTNNLNNLTIMFLLSLD